nr:hypothetical protein Itr_chr12CG19640 [Ipomoea trifida]
MGKNSLAATLNTHQITLAVQLESAQHAVLDSEVAVVHKVPTHDEWECLGEEDPAVIEIEECQQPLGTLLHKTEGCCIAKTTENLEVRYVRHLTIKPLIRTQGFNDRRW